MLYKTNSAAAARRLFLRAQNGKLNSSKGSFSRISGSIVMLDYREHVDKDGERYHNWHILIDDDSVGEYYDIAFSKLCDGFGYLLSSLLKPEGLEALSNVTIDFIPYKTKGTMAIVSSREQKIACGERMPDLDSSVGGDGKTMYDGSARIAWMQSAVDRINAHIANSKDDVKF